MRSVAIGFDVILTESVLEFYQNFIKKNFVLLYMCCNLLRLPSTNNTESINSNSSSTTVLTCKTSLTTVKKPDATFFKN